MKKAKIPTEGQVFKTKQQIALELIEHQISSGSRFDYVNADAFMGQTKSLQMPSTRLHFLASKRLLVIRENIKKRKKEMKFALGNVSLEHYKSEQIAYMQAQRFFIEHSSKEAK